MMEWVAFNVFLIVLVAIDLGIFSRKAHVIHVREAMIRSAIWVAVAFAFAGFMWWYQSKHAALNYINGYLVEEVLSVDNLFVMLIIFSYFQVPRNNQHRVLLWGIFGALVMRGVFIVCGVELVQRFHWLLYPLGALLVYTALKLLVSEEQYDPEHNWFLRFSRRYLPITKTYDKDHFFSRVDGRWMITPLFVVLWVINTTDLLFAIDSVPAVIGVVKPPDAFIVYSSNAFAIVGLRSLYFALAGMMDAFHFLRYGLAAILAFVGIKMLVDAWVDIPNWIVLTFVGGSLAISIGASLLFKKPEQAQPEDASLSTAGEQVETAG
ncbi:MAG TPA: TerC family protein [Planctomycetaceae bacterium]|jgi:tellurite resistance protein TerC|nr:TerC family protein [Planctomycetaceae bacterium]